MKRCWPRWKRYNDVAPAHNPPYVAAMRLLARELPEIPLVAAFETGFHETIAPAERLYAVPLEWAEKYGIRRWGFHGASHRYIAERAAQLLDKPEAKIISCHLGGSSSLCAIAAGSRWRRAGHESAERLAAKQPRRRLRSVRPAGHHAGHGQDAGAGAGRPGQSLGSARPVRRATTCATSKRQQRPRRRAGAAGARRVRRSRAALPRGVSAAAERSRRHRLHRRHRRKLGAHACGRSAPISTGSASISTRPPTKRAKGEAPIHAPESRVQLWIMPTNEELIVARQAKELLELRGCVESPSA